MAKRITGDLAVSVTTKAQDVDIRFRDFLLVNNSEATVYFREKGKDGVDVTAKTGYAMLPKTQLPHAITADVLSILGSASADVRILFVDMT